MHDCRCSDTLRWEITVTLPNVIKSTSIDRTPFDRRDLAGIQVTPVGFTQAGYSYLGDPDAPVTPEEYGVFLCSFCAHHFEQMVPSLVERFLQTGQAIYAFRDMPLVGPDSTAPTGQRVRTGYGDRRLPRSVTGRLLQKRLIPGKGGCYRSKKAVDSGDVC